MVHLDGDVPPPRPGDRNRVAGNGTRHGECLRRGSWVQRVSNSDSDVRQSRCSGPRILDSHRHWWIWTHQFFTKYGLSALRQHTHTHTHTHTHLTTLFPVPERWNQSGFYWSNRQWVAVASAGTYACLHLAPDRQPRQRPTTQFFTGRMPFLPPNSVSPQTKWPKCTLSIFLKLEMLSNKVPQKPRLNFTNAGEAYA